jgi:outer membrane protein
MKYFFRIIPALFFIVFFQTSTSGADSLKIGVVDMQKFQAKSKGFQKSSDRLKQKYQGMKDKLEAEVKELQKIEEEFKKQSLMLSLDAQGGKRRELESKKRYIQFLRTDFTEQMKESDMENSQKIVKELEKIVGKIAKDKKFTLIFNRQVSGLIYVHPTFDITDEVVKVYDATKQ